MELDAPYLLLSLALLLSSVFFLLLKLSKNVSNQLPPGPPGWPVLGNIFDLGPHPHQTMYQLRPKYGPLLWLKLGSVNTMVVQSAKAAEQLFKNHDLAFCNRWSPHALTVHNYNNETASFSAYGAYWRLLRRLYSTELLGNNKGLNETVQKRVDDMVRNIEEESAAAIAHGESGEVELSHFLFVMSFNVVGSLAFSRDLLGPHNTGDGREYLDAMNELLEVAGKPNVADYFPWLKWLDPQGIYKENTRYMGRALNIVSGFIAEKVEKLKLETQVPVKRDFVEALLSYRSSDAKEDIQSISEHKISIILMEMFMGGSETTSTTLEWAMAELLHDPEKMKKAKEELNRIIGPHKKIDEGVIDKLPYLQAVMKETIRLHPVVPLLLPRTTSEDTNYMGYMIPKDTQVFVNVWAIGRDSDVWKEPLSFKPERFMESHSNIEYRGQNYELLPFGSGRRICAGIPLAHKVLHITLASLLHYFDWKLGGGVTPETMDMNEKIGITTPKLVPLKVIPKKCTM